MKHLSATLQSYDVFDDVWLPYWSAPERTQEEFDSISHSFNIRVKPSKNYPGYLGPTTCIQISCYNGMINCSDYGWYNGLKKLTDRFKIIVDAQFETKLYEIASTFAPNNIGLRLGGWPMNFNPFLFLATNQNVNYLDANPKRVELYLGPQLMDKYLDTVTISCNGEVDIHLPIHRECLDKVHCKFPRMKSVQVLGSKDEILPQIDGVKVSGFDPDELEYF